MVMKTKTQESIYSICRSFAAKMLSKARGKVPGDIGQAYPFHQLFFSEEAIRAARLERSVVTSMGTNLYPALAEAIAKDRFNEVFLDHAIEGVVNDAAANLIEQIVTELRTSVRKPHHEAELRDIFNSMGGGQSHRVVTADVYVADFRPGPLFIELKTPKPNLDIAAESKRKLLYYLTIMHRKGVSQAGAFLGFTYNPFMTREKYKHNFTNRVMDINRQVLMGEELWDYLGGPGAYKELLAIIRQVRQELSS